MPDFVDREMAEMEEYDAWMEEHYGDGAWHENFFEKLNTYINTGHWMTEDHLTELIMSDMQDDDDPDDPDNYDWDNFEGLDVDFVSLDDELPDDLFDDPEDELMF